MRRGDWMQTASGRQFWPLDPRPEEIEIGDIAHALSNQCRFGGHVSTFLSVAEHCVRVSRLCSPEHALWGLLHDAAEGYLTDLPRPIKYASEIGTAYQAAESRLMAAICERFGLPPEEPLEVKEADDRVCLWEKRDLMAPEPAPWKLPPLDVPTAKLVPWHPEVAKYIFLIRFEDLFLIHFEDLTLER